MILRPTTFRIHHDPAAAYDGEHLIDFRVEGDCVVIRVDTELEFAITAEFGRKLVAAVGNQALLGIGTVELFLNEHPTMKLTSQAAQVFCRELWGWCELGRRVNGSRGALVGGPQGAYPGGSGGGGE